jgi:hypothetical protein
MQRSSAWFELSTVSSGLMILMLIVMWAQRPAEDCALSIEAPRALVLDRETDREHLATEVGAAHRTAQRYMRQSADLGQQPTRLAECQAALVQQIATRHAVSPDHVRASLADVQ